MLVQAAILISLRINIYEHSFLLMLKSALFNLNKFNINPIPAPLGKAHLNQSQAINLIVIIHFNPKSD